MAAKQDGVARDLTDLGMGGVSAMFATVFTNPIEVVKTRMQLQGELRARGAGSVRYRSVPHALVVVTRREGFRALQSGLPAMMGFQFFLNTFRLGVYRISERRGLTTDANGRLSLLRGAAAAAVGGALGSVAGTPFFLVKTRLQAKGGGGTVKALGDVWRREGVTGLFRGAYPQVWRGASGSGAQLVSFSLCKQELAARGWLQTPIASSFAAACVGGVVMTLCLNPFDVVATRLSNQGLDAHNRGKLYSGMADCFLKILRTEGVHGLYKGVMANYLRLGPHTVLLLVCWDQLKALEDYLRK